MLAGLATAAAAAPAANINAYPTSERVVFVEACMRDHPGPHYEMLNKCSCTLDRLAESLPFDDFVTMSTAANASSIGGERGGVIRDSEPLQQQVRRFRQMQAAAQKSCMLQTAGVGR
jgi:hypothetical protein